MINELYIDEFTANSNEICPNVAVDRATGCDQISKIIIAAFNTSTFLTVSVRLFFTKLGDCACYNFANFCRIRVEIISKVTEFHMESENVRRD